MSGSKSRFANHHSRVAKRSGRGFTLVELLVVIGIIAVLISILLPALNSARKQAQSVACLSNLRQMGIAATMYISEWKYYPGSQARMASNTVDGAVWPARLRNYMKGNQAVFTCPTQNSEYYTWKTNNTTPPVATASDSGYGYKIGESVLRVNTNILANAGYGYFSYGYNDWGSGQIPAFLGGGITKDTATSRQLGLGGDIDDPNKFNLELKASRVKKPTSMIMIADNTPDGNYDFNIDPRDPKEAPGSIHKGGANVLFCDGHAVWMHQRELVLYKVGVPNYQAYVPQSGQYQSISKLWNNDNKPH